MTTETAADRLRLAQDGMEPRSGNNEALTAPFVAQPQTVDETGLDFSMLLDLVVKSIYFGGRPSARTIAAQLALNFPVID